MGQFLFNVTSESEAPAAPGWTSILDNTKWSVVFGTWTGSQWDSEHDNASHYVRLEAIGTWADGYQPTKARVTYELADTDLRLVIQDSDSAVNWNADVASEEEVALTMFGLDIFKFQLVDFGDDDFSLTNIEFFG